VLGRTLPLPPPAPRSPADGLDAPSDPT